MLLTMKKALALSLFLLGCDGVGTGVCEESFSRLNYSLKDSFLKEKSCATNLVTDCGCDMTLAFGGVKTVQRITCSNAVYLEESYPYWGLTIRYKDGVISNVSGGRAPQDLKTCYSEKVPSLDGCKTTTSLFCSQP